MKNTKYFLIVLGLLLLIGFFEIRSTSSADCLRTSDEIRYGVGCSDDTSQNTTPGYPSTGVTSPSKDTFTKIQNQLHAIKGLAQVQDVSYSSVVTQDLKNLCNSAKKMDGPEKGYFVSKFKDGKVKDYDADGGVNSTNFNNAYDKLVADQGNSNDVMNLTQMHSHPTKSGSNSSYGKPPSVADLISSVQISANTPGVQRNFYAVDGGNGGNGSCNVWHYGVPKGSALENQINKLLANIKNISPPPSQTDLIKYVSSRDSPDLYDLMDQENNSTSDARVSSYINTLKNLGGLY